VKTVPTGEAVTLCPVPVAIRVHPETLPQALRLAIGGLARPGVLPGEFAARLRAVAGLRDLRVHGCLDVDLEVLAGVLSDHLDGFPEFARYVKRWPPP